MRADRKAGPKGGTEPSRSATRRSAEIGTDAV
jgi:hypothetical protein